MSCIERCAMKPIQIKRCSIFTAQQGFTARLTTKVPTNIGFPMMVIGLCLKLGSFRPLDRFSIFRFEHDNIEEQKRMWESTIEFASDCTRFSLSELHLNLMVFYVILQTSQELRMLSPSLFIQGSQCKC